MDVPREKLVEIQHSAIMAVQFASAVERGIEDSTLLSDWRIAVDEMLGVLAVVRELLVEEM